MNEKKAWIKEKYKLDINKKISGLVILYVHREIHDKIQKWI